MAISAKAKAEMLRKFNIETLKRHQKRVIPALKEDVREDTGRLKNSIYSKIVESERQKQLVVRTVIDVPYAWILELRHGILKTGSLQANFEEYVKMVRN